MNKLLIILLAMTLVACGASKNIRNTEKSLKGIWILNEVKASAIGDLKFEIFDQSSRRCMEGSTWQFVPNNNTGVYSEAGVACNEEKHYFVFSIEETNDFKSPYNLLLKPTDIKSNSETNIGYRLDFKSQSESDMVWEQTVNFEGKPLTVTFNFIKS